MLALFQVWGALNDLSTNKNNQLQKIRPLLFLLAFCVLTGITLLIEWRKEQAGWTQAGQSGSSAGMSAPPETGPAESETAGTDAGMAEKFPVYLVGAVAGPGIYRVEAGTFLFELIEEAGGLRDDAAAEQINLALPLQAYQHIYIPTIDEAGKNPALLAPLQSEADNNRLIDINRADQATLEKLPGIGPVTAGAIIAYREKNGSFARIEDLMQVPGIKESRFSALQDLIMVSGEP